jgi:hypothetical protein
LANEIISHAKTSETASVEIEAVDYVHIIRRAK